MKISKLLMGLCLPFLIFAFVGSLCPDDEDQEPDVCKITKSQGNLYKLTGPAGSVEFKTGDAEASCKASFYVVFGWKDIDRFTSPTQVSPMQEGFGGLRLTFGEDTYGKTFTAPAPEKGTGDSPYNNIKGFVWTIKFEVSPVVNDPTASTQFYVYIQHTILKDEDYDFFVEARVVFSELQ